MLPLNPYIQIICQILLVVGPIVTSYQGVPLPAWTGLAIAVINGICSEILKRMAPASDVHKDSELPDQQAPPKAPQIDMAALAAALEDERERRRQERVRNRLREVANDNVSMIRGREANGG